MRFQSRWRYGVAALMIGVSLMGVAVTAMWAARWVALNREGVSAMSREEFLDMLGDGDDRTTSTQRLRLAATAQPPKSVVALRVMGRSLSAYECKLYCSIGTLVFLELYDCEIPTGYAAKVIAANPRLQVVVLESSRCNLEPLDLIANHKNLQLLSTFQSTIPEPQVQTLVERGINVSQEHYFRMTR
jgi:hypothetical protein